MSNSPKYPQMQRNPCQNVYGFYFFRSGKPDLKIHMELQVILNSQNNTEK